MYARLFPLQPLSFAIYCRSSHWRLGIVVPAEGSGTCLQSLLQNIPKVRVLLASCVTRVVLSRSYWMVWDYISIEVPFGVHHWI